MSLMLCESCEHPIDTDAHPETWRGYETDDKVDAWLCDTCWGRDPRNPENGPDTDALYEIARDRQWNS